MKMDCQSAMYAILNELQFNYYVQDFKPDIETHDERTGEDSRVFVLSGNVEKIQECVIKPLAKKVASDEQDFEFCEMSANYITTEFARTFPAPKGRHGGVLIISDLLDFIKEHKSNDQIRIIWDILEFSPIGRRRSGWAIVFLTKETDDNKWWNYSFCPYYMRKSMLRSFLVEE